MLPRSFFSERKGGNLLFKFSTTNSSTASSVPVPDQGQQPSGEAGENINHALQSRYVACASLNALSLYLERTYNLQLDKETEEISLKYYFVRSHMHLDPQTCQNLDLFPSPFPEKQGKTKAVNLISLFSPVTTIGKKNLKKRLFSPYVDTRKLSKMYDYVEVIKGIDK